MIKEVVLGESQGVDVINKFQSSYTNPNYGRRELFMPSSLVEWSWGETRRLDVLLLNSTTRWIFFKFKFNYCPNKA